LPHLIVEQLYDFFNRRWNTPKRNRSALPHLAEFVPPLVARQPGLTVLRNSSDPNLYKFIQIYIFVKELR